MTTTAWVVLAAAPATTPPDPTDTGDVGTQGPIGLVLILLLLIAVAFLVKSMTTHLKRVPRSFDPEDDIPQIPDTPEELLRPRPEPGEELLEQLRRAPRAIEPPRRRNGRPDAPPGEA
jgi:hypothetical protein